MLHAPSNHRAMWALARTCASIALATMSALGGCTCQDGPTESPPRLASEATEPAPEPWSDAWLIKRAEQYLSSTEHRRESMVKSLRNPKNLYSRQRIAAYGRENKGWDALPVWNPRSEVLRVTEASERSSEPAQLGPAQLDQRVWDGSEPKTADAWRKLGKTVFHRYPLRADAFVAFGIRSQEHMARFGLHRDAEGRVPGVVRFVDVDGKSKVGITCALCHSSVQEGAVIDGLARRDIDYGALRLAMHKETETPVDPELARRMATWGPGRADITEDEAEDPVAIPDLWNLRHYESLTQAGTIRHIGPVALALRQETQLLHANHQRTRPPRVLAWALAMYMYSLQPPPRTSSWQPPSKKLVQRGETLFEEHCERCHSNPSGGGPVVDAPKLGTNQALAFGVARGTGKYRPPNLTRVADAAPYFHTGTLPDLAALFDPARLEPAYVGANGRKGAVTGHEFGLNWEAQDKASMIAFLQNL